MRYLLVFLSTVAGWQHGVAFAAPPVEAAPQQKIDLFSRGRCRSSRGIRFLVAPRRSFAGEPLRVVALASTFPVGVVLVAQGPQGSARFASSPAAGPPQSLFGELVEPRAGRYRFAVLARDGRVLGCVGRSVAARRSPRLRAQQRLVQREAEDLWPVERSWSRRMEDLYAVWIERLFDAPLGARPSWTPLHQVLHDPRRNFLHNYLNRDEDGPRGRDAVQVTPDCADLPYFLRGYFAWKLRLPMGYRHCDRGSARRYARCQELRTNAQQVVGEPRRPAALAFTRFLRHKLSFVHSGSARTGPDDDATDLFPLALTARALRPGAVYVDPYGHLLVVAKWVPQGRTRGGVLFAVDGHPDLSVGRKRFWRGAFLFTQAIKGGGFKAFRPLVVREGQIVALTNQELRQRPDYRGLYSPRQSRLNADAFYLQMDRLLNPWPLAPELAYAERMAALFELMQERVDSVQAGETYGKKNAYAPIAMPSGPRIFETQGAWENFSTPARDLRLLIAIDEVANFPLKVRKYPGRFAIAPGTDPEALERRLRGQLAAFAKSHAIRYTNSDGTAQELSMAALIGRARALEVAYNPNDCVELRWGASGRELASCRRHAPPDQAQRMARYRRWFATRQRPALR